jgi:hypothetical protein
MVSGAYPPTAGATDPAVEPLCYWLPRLLGSLPRVLAPEARRAFCDRLVLRQDDAWRALIAASAAPGGGCGAAPPAGAAPDAKAAPAMAAALAPAAVAPAAEASGAKGLAHGSRSVRP